MYIFILELLSFEFCGMMGAALIVDKLNTPPYILPTILIESIHPSLYISYKFLFVSQVITGLLFLLYHPNFFRAIMRVIGILIRMLTKFFQKMLKM